MYRVLRFLFLSKKIFLFSNSSENFKEKKISKTWAGECYSFLPKSTSELYWAALAIGENRLMAYCKILQGMDFCPFFIGIHQKTAVMQTTPTVKLTKPWTLLGAKRLVTIYQNTLHNLTNPILSWQNSRIYCNVHKNCKNTVNHLKLSILDTHLSLYKYIKTTISMFFTLRLCKTM